MPRKARKSPKRKTKAQKKGLVKRKQTLMDRLPKNEIERMELIIFFTERAIGNPAYPNQTMVDQAIRLKKELAEMKAAKKS